MKRLFASFIVILCAFASPVWSQSQTERLIDTLMLPQLISIMRQEGLASAEELFSGVPGGSSDEVLSAVDAIYDEGVMLDTVRDGMAKVLEGKDSDVLVAFFASGVGQEIINLELTAREAYLDEGVEEAANAIAGGLEKTDPNRYGLLKEYIDINDLIDTNVVGALNSNLAFFQGMNSVGAFETSLTESDMLNEIWSQEAEIRQDTTQWLYSFLSMAYQPLADEDLQLYIDFSGTDHGRLLNEALFEGFDDMFLMQSNALGKLFGRMSKTEEL